MTPIQFLQAATTLYPDLQAELAGYDGLFHLQMDRFRVRVERDIRARDESAVKAALTLAARACAGGDAMVRSAVDTSFAEALFAGHSAEDAAWAWARTPDTLRRLYLAVWGRPPL